MICKKCKYYDYISHGDCEPSNCCERFGFENFIACIEGECELIDDEYNLTEYGKEVSELI